MANRIEEIWFYPGQLPPRVVEKNPTSLAIGYMKKVNGTVTVEQVFEGHSKLEINNTNTTFILSRTSKSEE